MSTLYGALAEGGTSLNGLSPPHSIKIFIAATLSLHLESLIFTLYSVFDNSENIFTACLESNHLTSSAFALASNAASTSSGEVGVDDPILLRKIKVGIEGVG